MAKEGLEFTFEIRFDKAQDTEEAKAFRAAILGARTEFYYVRKIAPGILICDNEQAAKAWNACFVPRIGRERMN